MLPVTDVLQVGQRERHSASLADLLRVGARPLALEARSNRVHRNNFGHFACGFDHHTWGENQQHVDGF